MSSRPRHSDRNGDYALVLVLALAVSLSVAGLLVGPALFAWARGRSLATATLDGAILGFVPALVLVRILPHLVEEAGIGAILALASGYGVYVAAESRSHGQAGDVGLTVVVPSLAIHSFLDGASLAVAFSHTAGVAAGVSLGAALVVHKVPEGLFLASRFRRVVGTRGLFVRVGALGVITVVGALAGQGLLSRAPHDLLHITVALGLGVMLAMVVHRHDEGGEGRKERAVSGLAFLASMAAVVAMRAPGPLLGRYQPNELSAMQALTPLFLESAPWLLGALILGELGRGVGRGSNGQSPSAWVATTTLLAVLLGPPFAVVRGALDPLVRWAVGKHSRATWALAIAPPASLVLPSYAVGVVLSVAAEASVPASLVDAPVVLTVAGAVLAGALLPVGSPGAAVIAAVFVHKGIPLAGALAFLLVGATMGATASRAAKGAALALVGAAALLAAAPLAVLRSPPLHELGAHGHGWGEWAAAGALTAWIAFELVRQGPRGWFGVALRRGDPSPVVSAPFGSPPLPTGQPSRV